MMRAQGFSWIDWIVGGILEWTIDAYDADGDGALSYEEFAELIEDLTLGLINLNGDDDEEDKQEEDIEDEEDGELEPMIVKTQAEIFAKLGDHCKGFNEATELPFPNCDVGLICENSGMVGIPGTGKVCVAKETDPNEKEFAQEGKNCEGFNEVTGLPFPNCAAGLVCRDHSEINIPGADKVCVPESTDDVRVSENQFGLR
jgi:hypothetical protein